MNRIEIYKSIKSYYEDRFTEINERYYRLINEKLLAKNSILKDKINLCSTDDECNFNFLHNYILQNKLNIEYLYELIEKYNYNFIHTLLWGISSICNTDYPKTEEYIINLLLRSPYIYSINKYSDYYIIDCILGKVPFKKATTYFGDLNLLNLRDYVIENDLSSLCHKNSLKVVSTIKNSTAYTGLCKQAFTGTFYHSIALHDKNCIDLNYKAVIPFDTYKKVTDFKPIITIDQNKINYIKDEDLLLYLALSLQSEDQEIQKKLNFTL